MANLILILFSIIMHEMLLHFMFIQEIKMQGAFTKFLSFYYCNRVTELLNLLCL